MDTHTHTLTTRAHVRPCTCALSGVGGKVVCNHMHSHIHTHSLPCLCALSEVRGKVVSQTTLGKHHLHQGTTGAEAGEDGGWGGAMWSAGTWAQDDTAGPVAEATEESHANATKHGSSRVELTQGRSALWDAQLEDGRGGGAPTSRWGKVAPGFASSQVSKEGGENEMRRSTKKWQVWKDAASEVDEGESHMLPWPLSPFA
eukprot:scaffold31650_cov23-Tisochrysis_lutea.AAC.3